MWSEKPASAEARVARYWDDLVTGAPAATDIEPSLQQTIAWLERIDDARPASAEFSRRFETQYLSAIGAANSRAEASTEPLVWRPKQRDSHKSNNRGVPLPGSGDRLRRAGGYSWNERLLVPLVAAAVLIVSLVAIYYAFEHRDGSRDS